MKYKFDLYFHDYRLAAEVNEYGHCDRNSDYERNREKMLKEELCIH